MPGHKRMGTPGALGLYTFAVLALSLGFGALFPGLPVPLELYSIEWRLATGLVTFISLFPGLALSALVVPFGFHDGEARDYGSFSLKFLESMTKPIMTAIVATVIYGALFLLALPLLLDAQADMSLKGELYYAARDRAEAASQKKAWLEASYHLATCERIWPHNENIEKLRDTIHANREMQENTAKAATPVTAPESGRDAPVINGYTTPLTATGALNAARRALEDDKPYDAHWFAALASRLAKPGSPEAAEATLLAGTAWQAVTSLEPNESEKEAYRVYHRKREGYQALDGEDWIRAYYIFKELADAYPQDPDLKKYLDSAGAKISKLAFFKDEIGRTVGEVHTDAVFSLYQSDVSASLNRRIVVRVESLSLFSDVAYGTGFEALAVDSEGREEYRITAPYVKLMPLNTNRPSSEQEKEGNNRRTMVLLRMLDRDSEATVGEAPRESGKKLPDAAAGQLFLNIDFADLLLASRAQNGIATLALNDLFAARDRLGDYGFIPQAIQAEIIHRLFEPAVFLALSILVLAVGWRLRSPRGAGFIGIPLVIIMPVFFYFLVTVYHVITDTIALWLILSLGYAMALLIFSIVALALFIFALLFLAGQHG